MKLYSNEIVFRGHPDKVCDQISSAILDACLRQDPRTRAGIEVVGGKGKIFITGEITTKAKFNAKAITKRVLSDVGYESDKLPKLGKRMMRVYEITALEHKLNNHRTLL